jgi:predicted DNA-binding transcriptional regulator YafY
MSRKKETLTLSVPPGTKAKLDAIARRLKIFWGKSPSPSGLITKIAEEKLTVGEPFSLTPEQIEALQSAIAALTDTGQIETSKSVINFLLERGNLETPLRQSLIQRISHPSEAWRIAVDRQIAAKRAFRLIYRSGQNQQEEFTVRYGEIRFREKRFYLEAWCEEVSDRDLPEIKHNRTFRLDRILNILEIGGEWREGLDFIEIQLHFLRGLVNAYESKPEDIFDEVRGDIRYVVRRVSNLWWFFRDIASYYEDCAIVLPTSVRDRHFQKVKKLYQSLESSQDSKTD